MQDFNVTVNKLKVVKTEPPLWLKMANKDSYLTLKDVLLAVGLSRTCIEKRIKNGLFPSHDSVTRGFIKPKSGDIGIRLWKKQTVLGYFKGLTNEQSGTQKTGADCQAQTQQVSD